MTTVPPSQLGAAHMLADADPLGGVLRRGPALNLSTVDIGLLVALQMLGKGSPLAAFDDDTLRGAFDDVERRVAAKEDGAALRFTHALRRLRDQGMLTRVDGARMLRSGEYVVSRLGTAIAEFYLEQESLSEESLRLLSTSIQSALLQLVHTARTCQTANEFLARVCGALRITVSELARGIERRQRGFDLEQSQHQALLGELLSANWTGAIEQCERLLDATAKTLHELAHILLQDTQVMRAALLDINDEAVRCTSPAGEDAVRQVLEHIDRIAAWGAERQGAWSEYYQYIHRYLRDVVRVDPHRLLTTRLRGELTAAGSYALITAQAPPLTVLRDTMPEGKTEAPSRPKREPKAPPEQVEIADPDAPHRAAVHAALAAGATGLEQITAAVVVAVPEAARFALAGRIAEWVAQAPPPYTRKLATKPIRPWHAAHDSVELEEWRVL
jgi:chromosome partition protein MukF